MANDRAEQDTRTMLSTRTHGAIDYAVAGLLGALATATDLPRPVRRVLGGAAAYHTSYALLTDYEYGVRRVLDMEIHLTLDALGAAGLCAAGLLLRGVPPSSRALLFGIGAAEFAVIAASADPDEADPAYPPLDTPKQVAPDVWVVDSTLPGAAGRVAAARMTVIRLPDGGLILHSPTRYSTRLRRELERRGTIRHLVAPSFGHWMFLADWQRNCADTIAWAAPGLPQRRPVRRSGIRFDHVLPGRAAQTWDGAVRVVIVPGGMGFAEAALFHEPTRTLVLTDLVQNLRPRKLPLLVRPLARLVGSSAPGGTTPRHVRLLLRMRLEAVRAAAAELLALRPERVIFAHGDSFGSDGTAALRRSLAWVSA